MNIFEYIGVDIQYVTLALIAISIILFILLLITMIKQNKLKKKYKAFMQGKDGTSLEEEIISKFREIEFLKNDIKKVTNDLKRIDETLLTAYKKIGIVKYDAFDRMGGKLSFVLALLNSTNDGFIINSMHSTSEGCYTYIKEIIKGESFLTLSDEERQALKEAINSNNYLD